VYPAWAESCWIKGADRLRSCSIKCQVSQTCQIAKPTTMARNRGRLRRTGSDCPSGELHLKTLGVNSRLVVQVHPVLRHIYGNAGFFARPRGLCQDIGGEHGTIEMAAKLTSTIIQAAIDGFEAQKKNIDAQIAELRAMLTGAPESAAEDAPAKGTRRKFSAASRRRMREAQQLRWAKIKGESLAPAKTATKAAKPKRGITAAGRKALSIAMKKRWAAKKAA